MGSYSRILGTTVYGFNDLKDVMACASAHRSGDVLAGIAASSNERRLAARFLLADLPLTIFLEEMLIDPATDEVSRLILSSHDEVAFHTIKSLTVGGLRDWLLSDAADSNALTAIASGLTPEMVAAVSKLMRNIDLLQVSAKCRVVTRFRTTIGLPGRLAARLQPNHPTDDAHGIFGSIVDGLLFGVGDAMIGLNPATDSLASYLDLVDLIETLRLRFDIPVQGCVLSHVTTTVQAIEQGAPVDLVFQSIAGSEQANSGFGVSLSLLSEAYDAGRALGRASDGQQFMYFETGQGSALSSSSHFGVDQQTMEARAYAVARAFDPFLVNTVVGFIGPEYLYDGKQIVRAGLEDYFCGKLLGLPMGADVCYTNHAEADQDDIEGLACLLATAGLAFLIAVPGGDDIMLNYQSLSYHDIAAIRQLLSLAPAPEFAEWLERMQIADRRGRMLSAQGRPLVGQMLRGLQ